MYGPAMRQLTPSGECGNGVRHRHIEPARSFAMGAL